MTFRKKIKIALGSILGIAFLFFAVLIVHIAIMVKNRKPLENATIQMARADFKQPVNTAQASLIEQNIKKLKGVKNTFFNPSSNILVYTFDATLNNATAIYISAIRSSGIASTQYILAKGDEAKGCPVINDNSFYGKLTAAVSYVMN